MLIQLLSNCQHHEFIAGICDFIIRIESGRLRNCQDHEFIAGICDFGNLILFQMTAAAAATAATTSQELSHLARPLDHHAQGPNIPFGESLTSINYIPEIRDSAGHGSIRLVKPISKSELSDNITIENCAKPRLHRSEG